MSIWVLASCSGLLAALPDARADEDTTAVNSKVLAKDYVRAKLPDGSFAPEEYALGNGSRSDKPTGDTSIDNLAFPEMARVVAMQLKAQNFLPTKDVKTGKLMIIVRWAKTTPPDLSNTTDWDPGVDTNISSGINEEAVFSKTLESALKTRIRAQTDERNANLLGYDFERFPNNGETTTYNIRRSEVVSEIEHARYFVLLMAHDFQVYLRQKKLKELWETRVSISSGHTNFTRALPTFGRDAASYFGQDSHGLQRVTAGQATEGGPNATGRVGTPQN